MGGAKANKVPASYAVQVLPLLIERGAITAADAASALGGTPPSCRNALNLWTQVMPHLVGRRAAEDEIHAHEWVWRGAGTQGLTQDDVALRLRSLMVLRAVASQLPSSTMMTAIEAMLAELAAAAGVGTSDVCRMVVAHSNSRPCHDAASRTFDDVLVGLLEHRVLSFEYTSMTGRRATQRIEPWTLTISPGGLHLYGRQTKAKGRSYGHAGLYAVARMRDTRLEQPFVYPAATAYPAQERWRSVFSWWVTGEPGAADAVELEFDASWRPYLESTLIHPTMQIRQDGSGDDAPVRVTLNVCIAYDLVHWVRGHGVSVRVLAPERLRRWVLAGTQAEPRELEDGAVGAHGVRERR